MQQVVVLYEDKRGPTQNFGLHALVKACVCDGLPHQTRQDIHHALGRGRTLGGDTLVLKKLWGDVDDIAESGQPVVAVLDNDRIRRALNLPAAATRERVLDKIHNGISSERVRVVLLDKNLESVIRAAHKCDPSIDEKRVDDAIDRKNRLERDAILNELTGAQFRAVRDCIREKLSSFQELVDLLCELIQRPARTRKKT